jgi:hypothetical protein
VFIKFSSNSNYKQSDNAHYLHSVWASNAAADLVTLVVIETVVGVSISVVTDDVVCISVVTGTVVGGTPVVTIDVVCATVVSAGEEFTVVVCGGNVVVSGGNVVVGGGNVVVCGGNVVGVFVVVITDVVTAFVVTVIPTKINNKYSP